MEFICFKNKLCFNKETIKSFKKEGNKIYIWDNTMNSISYETEEKANEVFEKLKTLFKTYDL